VPAPTHPPSLGTHIVEPPSRVRCRRYWDPLISPLDFGTAASSEFAGGKTAFLVTTSFVASGSVDDYDETLKANIIAAFQVAAGLSPSDDWEIEVTAASVNIVITYTAASEADADAAISQIESSLGAMTTADLQNFLVAQGVRGVTVESAPTLAKGAAPAGSNASDNMDMGIIIGASAGGLVVVLGLAYVAYVKWYKAGSKVVPGGKGATEAKV